MRLRVNRVELHVADFAGPPDQPALVLLHHFGGSSRTWSEVIEHLRPDFHTTALDLRGFGASSPGESQRVADMVEDVLEVVQHLGLPRYVLTGHSMGGKVALVTASKRPRGLQSLLLVAPSPPGPEPMEEAERRRLLKGYGNRAEAEKTNREIMGEPLPPGKLEALVADNLRASPEAWRSWLEAGSREDLGSVAADIAVPTWVLGGERDRAMTPEVLEREVVGRIDNAGLEALPGAGHLLPVERPAEVAAWIRRFAGV